jgi:hypothetical protein
VLFTGDKPSNYPDPEFIAKYNETNRVYLLIGKKYTATSDETITVVSKSSDNIIIDSISDNEIDIVLPVEFFLDEAKFAIAIEPPWCLGRITWQIPISWAAREAQHENEIVGVLPICYTQEFEIFQSGSFRLTKHGYWVERHADGSRSRSQGVLYQ